MLRGKISEKGPTKRIIDNPWHDYVKLLVDSIPRPDPSNRWNEEIGNNYRAYIDSIEWNLFTFVKILSIIRNRTFKFANKN